jgi:hypothetical protein
MLQKESAVVVTIRKGQKKKKPNLKWEKDRPFVPKSSEEEDFFQSVLLVRLAETFHLFLPF